MSIKNLSWKRRIAYGMALYAIISVSLGSLYSSTSLGAIKTPLREVYDGPVVGVYAARTWGKKGMLAVHTWIMTRRRGETHYNRHEIIGWKLRWSDSALRSDQWGTDDDSSWYGNEATLLVEHRGEGVEEMIGRIEAAIDNYPYKSQYRLWPGPNSNTFTAYLGLAVPELHLDLPSTAIGKDFRPVHKLFGRSASGTGLQLSLLGLGGFSIGYEEGVEANVLGINLEWDIFDWAIELPGLGRIGYRQ